MEEKYNLRLPDVEVLVKRQIAVVDVEPNAELASNYR
jgi:hypothetical protein